MFKYIFYHSSQYVFYHIYSTFYRQRMLYRQINKSFHDPNQSLFLQRSLHLLAIDFEGYQPTIGLLGLYETALQLVTKSELVAKINPFCNGSM